MTVKYITVLKSYLDIPENDAVDDFPIVSRVHFASLFVHLHRFAGFSLVLVYFIASVTLLS